MKTQKLRAGSDLLKKEKESKLLKYTIQQRRIKEKIKQ